MTASFHALEWVVYCSSQVVIVQIHTKYTSYESQQINVLRMQRVQLFDFKSIFGALRTKFCSVLIVPTVYAIYVLQHSYHARCYLFLFQHSQKSQPCCAFLSEPVPRSETDSSNEEAYFVASNNAEAYRKPGVFDMLIHEHRISLSSALRCEITFYQHALFCMVHRRLYIRLCKYYYVQVCWCQLTASSCTYKSQSVLQHRLQYLVPFTSTVVSDIKGSRECSVCVRWQRHLKISNKSRGTCV